MAGRTKRDITLALERSFGRTMRSHKTWPIPQDVAWSEIEEPMTVNQPVHWVRLPTYFPDFPLAMMPLKPQEREQLRETGWLRKVSFQTLPYVSKTEIRLLLELVYGMNVEKVMTLNLLGQPVGIPESGVRTGRTSDVKRVQVLFRPPSVVLKRLHQAEAQVQSKQEQQHT